jgi:hypothetical protein
MAFYKTIEGDKVANLQSGNMYFYKYEPLTPVYTWYDKYPLVFITRKRGNSIEGINFHYLSIPYRHMLYDALIPFFNNKEFTKDTRLNVKTIRMVLFQSAKYRFAKPTFHRYFQTGVRSQIIKVEPKNWKSVLSEKVEMFFDKKGKKINELVIHKDSFRKKNKK